MANGSAVIETLYKDEGKVAVYPRTYTEAIMLSNATGNATTIDEKFTQIDASLDDIKNNLIKNLTNALDSERTNRSKADDDIRELIEDETTDRETVDDEIRGLIAEESKNREQADATIQSSVNTLSNTINTVNTSMNTLNTSIQGTLNSMTEAFEAVNETVDSFDNRVDKIQSQIGAVKDPDAEDFVDLQTQVDQNGQKITLLDAKVDASVENLQTQIANEINNRELALQQEAAVRESKDTYLQEQIDKLNADSSTEGSVAYKIAQVVANADVRFDTLKEIADWIISDTTGATAMANDIAALKLLVGNEEVATQIANAIEGALKVEGVDKYALATDLTALSERVSALELKDTETVESINSLTATVQNQQEQILNLATDDVQTKILNCLHFYNSDGSGQILRLTVNTTGIKITPIELVEGEELEIPDFSNSSIS